MGDTENLQNKDAATKIKELAESADICIFATNLSKRPIPSRPMSTQKVDEEGNLWFLSSETSNKNHEIENEKEVQLFYSNKSRAEFLTIYGKAYITKDKEKAKELWTPIANAWFKDGVDDPDLTIIKVTPSDAYYWDTKNNKMISFLKIVTGAVAGKTSDDGREGRLEP